MTGINKYLKYFGIEIRKLNLNVYRFKQKYLLLAILSCSFLWFSQEEENSLLKSTLA